MPLKERLTSRLHWWGLVWFWWADLRSVRTVWFWLRFVAGPAPLQRRPGASASSSQDSPQSSCSPYICRWTSTWSLPNANGHQNNINTTENEPHLLYATRAWGPLPFDLWKHSPHNTRSSFSDSQISYNCSLCCVSYQTLLVCLYQSWVWKPQGFCLNTPGKKHITSYFIWYPCTSKHYSKTVLISETNKMSRAIMCYCYGVLGGWLANSKSG